MNKDIQLDEIFNNDEKRYAGIDLWYYAKKIFYAPNVRNPYHNFNHMMHVTYQVYDALVSMDVKNKDAFRYVLIASLFHDYGHTGDGSLPDSVNIRIAVNAIKRHIHPSDKKYLREIIHLIKSTEWHSDIGHAFASEDLFVNIIRDADMSQTFSSVWIQPVIFGLGYEKNISRGTMLRSQVSFLQKLKFNTVWGVKKFTPILQERIKQVNMLSGKILIQK